MKKIGLTTTVPIEILLSANLKPVDLNNLFVGSSNYEKYIEDAEKDGFPKSMCAWIKGLYGACKANNLNQVVGVMEGDCSNTKALCSVWQQNGILVYPLLYPSKHTRENVKIAIDEFMNLFGVNLEQVEDVRKSLLKVRSLAKKIDELTYIDNKATGFENHILQLCMSDFDTDVLKYENLLEEKIKEIEKRDVQTQKLRLGYIGVPPMTGDLYDFVETKDARIVFNEVQREFAFPRVSEDKDIYEQYYDYTYPYDIEFRLEEIKKQIKLRKLDGIIHYTQAFCYRAIDDIVIKANLDLPILNIEGDKLNKLDARTKLRIEAFLDMLGDLKK